MMLFHKMATLVREVALSGVKQITGNLLRAKNGGKMGKNETLRELMEKKGKGGTSAMKIAEFALKNLAVWPGILKHYRAHIGVILGDLYEAGEQKKQVIEHWKKMVADETRAKEMRAKMGDIQLGSSGDQEKNEIGKIGEKGKDKEVLRVAPAKTRTTESTRRARNQKGSESTHSQLKMDTQHHIRNETARRFCGEFEEISEDSSASESADEGWKPKLNAANWKGRAKMAEKASGSRGSGVGGSASTSEVQHGKSGEVATKRKRLSEDAAHTAKTRRRGTGGEKVKEFILVSSDEGEYPSSVGPSEVEGLVLNSDESSFEAFE